MAYQVRLKQFEGPLDLLLHLIEDAELDIKDIFVSEITSQYLSYMSELDELDMDTASEFLTMAATLLYIKSRQLLPRPPKEEETEEDPETLLIRQLREYKAFKEASAGLMTLFEQSKASYTRLPEDVVLPPKNVELTSADLDGLYAAFLAILARVPESAVEERASSHHVRPDHYTVRRQMRRIRDVLTAKPRVRFEELFAERVTKMEVIVTFMALLEMISHSEILLKQSAPFAPITITVYKLLLDEDDAEYEYMDETDE